MNNDVVLINLDRPRQLKYTNSALKIISASLGVDIETIDEKLKPTNFEMIEELIFQGLQFEAKKDGESITKEQVVEWLDEAPSQAHLYEKLFEAWYLAWGFKQGNVITPLEQTEKVENLENA